MLGLECTLDYIKHPQTRPHSGISNHTWKADVREWNAGNQRVACTVPQNKLAVSMGHTASTRGPQHSRSSVPSTSSLTLFSLSFVFERQDKLREE